MYVEMYGDKVKALREEKGMSTQELAEAAEVSLSTVRKAERSGRLQKGAARRMVLALGEEPSERWGRVIGRS